MENNYFIPRSTLLSQTARRIYRATAVLSLVLIPAIIAAVVLYSEDSPLSQATDLVIRIALLVGLIGMATTVTAMEYFMFNFDEQSSWLKMFWFAVLLLMPVGPLLYCFVVYSRSRHFNEAKETQQIGASA